MVLIDFHQLAVLYNLSHGDGEVLSNPSRPLPMLAATSSSSLLLLVEPDQTGSFSATQFMPKTPERKRDATRSVPDSTPLSAVTSILQKPRPDMSKTPRYDNPEYERYIIQDFDYHRVFVDIDVFMKHVLHVPENWKEEKQSGESSAIRPFQLPTGTTPVNAKPRASRSGGSTSPWWTWKMPFSTSASRPREPVSSLEPLGVTSGMIPKGFSAG